MRLPFRFFISSVAGLAALTATPLLANHTTDMVDYSGHARTRLQWMDNNALTDTDAMENIVNRVRFNLDVSPSKSLKVRISPEFTNTFDGDAGSVKDESFSAHEAWMSWMANDMFTLMVGRQVFDVGNGLILGANDWGQKGNHMDAVRARMTHHMGETHAFWIKMNERSAKGDGDHDIFGLYSMLNPDGMPMVKKTDLYAVWNDNRTDGANRSRVGTFGVLLGGDISMADYGLEIAAQMGKAGTAAGVAKNGDDIKGLMLNGNIGTKLMDKHHVAFNFDYANTEWQNIAPSNHAQLGMADIMNRNNLYAFAVMTDWALTDIVSAGLDGWYFLAAKDDAGTGGGLPTAANKRALGFELDASLSYKPEDHLTFDFGYNMFKPMSALEKNVATMKETHHDIYAQGTLTF